MLKINPLNISTILTLLALEIANLYFRTIPFYMVLTWFFILAIIVTYKEMQKDINLTSSFTKNKSIINNMYNNIKIANIAILVLNLITIIYIFFKS